MYDCKFFMLKIILCAHYWMAKFMQNMFLLAPITTIFLMYIIIVHISLLTVGGAARAALSLRGVGIRTVRS